MFAVQNLLQKQNVFLKIIYIFSIPPPPSHIKCSLYFTNTTFVNIFSHTIFVHSFTLPYLLVTIYTCNFQLIYYAKFTRRRPKIKHFFVFWSHPWTNMQQYYSWLMVELLLYFRSSCIFYILLVLKYTLFIIKPKFFYLLQVMFKLFIIISGLILEPICNCDGLWLECY